MTKKTCCRCGKKKKLEKFRVDRRRQDGRRGACAKCEREGDKARYYDFYSDKEKRARRVLDAAKQRARKREREFTITVADIMDQIDAGVCSLTGLPFSYDRVEPGRRNPYAPSIDRIDSSGGYTPDNIRVVCFAINMMLADFGAEVFEPVAKAYFKEASNGKPHKSKRKVPKKAAKPRHRPKDGVGDQRRERDQRVRPNRAV